MPNSTTSAFRKMMLNGRINEIMTEAVQEGVAATEAVLAAHKPASQRALRDDSGDLAPRRTSDEHKTSKE